MEQTSFVYTGTAFPAATYSNSYKFAFYDNWILDKAGLLEITVKLYGTAGNVLVSGKLTVSVDPSVLSTTVTITPDQYTDIVSQISSLTSRDQSTKVIQPNCVNKDTIPLTIGTAVYASGSVGASGKIEIKRASADYAEIQSNKLFGIVADNSIAVNAEGSVIIAGELIGVNTNISAITEGQPLYLSTVAGQLTSTPPTAPDHRIVVGGTIRKANNGIIYVKQQLGLDVAELCDVQITSVQNGNVLRWSGTRWENSAALTGAEGDIDQLYIDVDELNTNKADLSYTNAQLALKAPLASPALTGTPLAPTAMANTNNTQIATTAYADNAVGTLENYTDGQLDLKVDKSQTIIGIDLQDNILLGEFKTALGNATTSLDGLMSSADKVHLNALVALLEDSDGDSVVNTIGEILAIFNNYPEGADLVTALNGKVDKITGKGLSTNDYTDVEKDKVSVANTHALITDGSNPHATTFANITSKPTTIAGYNITDAYDKTYIDGLTDFNGWQQTNIATALTNGQTVATSTLTGYDRIMFVCRNTSTGELDTDEITSASVVNGYKINFFENASINFTFGTTTSTFNTTSGFELRVTGAVLTQQIADNINTNETGVTVQDALDKTNPLDAKIPTLNNLSLREVFENTEPLFNSTGTASGTYDNTTKVLNFLGAEGALRIFGITDQTLNWGTIYVRVELLEHRLSNNIGFEVRATGISNVTFAPISKHSIVFNANTNVRLRARNFSDVAVDSDILIYIIRMEQKGITHLTQAQLDEYFELYLKYKQTDNWFADLDMRKANRFIDIPIAELGDKTLREVFEGENLFDVTEFLPTVAGRAVFDRIENDFYYWKRGGDARWIQISDFQEDLSSSSLYYNIEIDTNLTTSYSILGITGILGSGNFSGVSLGVASGFNITAFNGSNHPTTAELGLNKESFYINLTDLGLTGLTKARLDFYFNLYQQYKTDNGLVAVADALNLLREDNREQDKRIADLEENLRKANSGAITATAIGVDTISLGKDTNNAPAQMLVEGGLLQTTQIVTNGDFSGTPLFTVANAGSISINTTTQIATLTHNGAADTQVSYRSNSSIILTNTKWYFNVKVKPLNSDLTYIEVNRGTVRMVGIDTPIINTTYILSIVHNQTDANQPLRVYGRYPSVEIGTGKSFEIYNIYAFNITTLIANKQYSPLFNTTFDLMTDANIKTQMDLWIAQGELPNNNIQAVSMNKRVRSVGKNLFDGKFEKGAISIDSGIDTATDNFSIRNIGFIKINANTSYTYSNSLTFTNNRFYWYNSNFNYISYIQANTATSPSNATYVRFRTFSSVENSLIGSTQIQLEENSIATTFVPYTTSDAFLQPNTLGYRVPNGVEDTVEFRNGKYYFVKRVQEYTLLNTDGALLDTTTLANLDFIRFGWGFLSNIFDVNLGDTVAIKIFTLRSVPRNSRLLDETTNFFFHDIHVSQGFRIFIPKGTYANLAAAQTDLAGTKIYYQLATPIETEILSLGIPQSYQGGTIYIDDMMADADLYTTNALISNTAYPIKSLDRIVRINADGSQTELAVSGATIAGDKLSFTHTGLVANDIVWFSYTYDIANTFQSLTTATYYDNPFIAVAPNGTARRLVPTVDNAGAVTWTSVAI
jgi:hypothetical protein